MLLLFLILLMELLNVKKQFFKINLGVLLFIILLKLLIKLLLIDSIINLKKLDLIKKIENEYQNHLKAVLMLMMLNLILLLKNGFVVLLLLVNQINMLDLFRALQTILQQIKLIGLNLLIKFKFKRISIMIYIMILLLVLKFLDK